MGQYFKTTRFDIINHLIEVYGYDHYLEIGTRDHGDLQRVMCRYKEGIDPAGGTTHTMTSDHFFSSVNKDKKWDIIFIDGDHSHIQVDKDIENSLRHLSLNGSIVMHDCGYECGVTSGNPRGATAWKSFAKLRCSRKDLRMHVVSTDLGCWCHSTRDSRYL